MPGLGSSADANLPSYQSAPWDSNPQPSVYKTEALTIELGAVCRASHPSRLEGQGMRNGVTPQEDPRLSPLSMAISGHGRSRTGCLFTSAQAKVNKLTACASSVAGHRARPNVPIKQSGPLRPDCHIHAFLTDAFRIGYLLLA